MAGRLEGKGAVVLGAAGHDNMGQVLVRRFLAEGAKVMAAGRNRAELERLAAETGCAIATCDITSRDDVFALAKAAKEQLGHVDIALNCTGWGLLKPFEKTTTEDLRKITDLQFIGPFQFFQAMVGVMDRGGSLLQISSATATIMLDDHAAYMGTKAGTDHVLRCVANEYGKRGIRANSISPGITESPMTASTPPVVWDLFKAAYPLGRIGNSDDIAAAAVWLSSDECFMTGQNLQVNGGLTLRMNPTKAQIRDALGKAAAR